jgi:hypothetical protein
MLPVSLDCFCFVCLHPAQDEDKQNKNSPEKLATWGTQEEEKQNKNNPEKLATLGTQGTG